MSPNQYIYAQFKDGIHVQLVDGLEDYKEYRLVGVRGGLQDTRDHTTKDTLLN